MNNSPNILPLGDRTVPYSIKVSTRGRGVRLSVTSSGCITVSAPWYVKESTVHDILISKSSWLLKKLAYFAAQPKREVISEDSKKDYILYKEKTRELVHKRLTYFNIVYNLTWSFVRIKNTTSRWGSCSKLGNLNFSYKLTLLPPHLADYIIVHEMCHLLELNHGASFWSHVQKTIPNYESLRKELKGYI